MDRVDKVDKTQTRNCPHREGAAAQWVNNDGRSAPVLYVEGCAGPTVVSLTNQVIRISCPSCFAEIRNRSRLTPDRLQPSQ